MLSSSTSCTICGSLPSSVRQLAAPRREGLTSEQAHEPALRLRDDLLAHDHDVAAPDAGTRSRRSAPPGRRPGSISGRPGTGSAAMRSVMPPARPSASRVRGARAGCRASASAAPTRPRRCRRPAPGRAPGSPRGPVPFATACSTWRARDPGPNCGSNAPAGSSDRRVGAGAVAVGHDRDVERLRSGDQLAQLAGVDQRAVAGHQQRALASQLACSRQARERGRGLPVLAFVDHRRRAGIHGARQRLRLPGHQHERPQLPLRASSFSTSSTIAAASTARSGPPKLSPRRCFALTKLFTGRIAAVGMASRTYPPSDSANSITSFASRARASPSGIEVSVCRRTMPVIVAGPVGVPRSTTMPAAIPA